ncbi:MAG TPA: DUF455 family protein [Chloroflexota bacterium]
MGVPNNTDYLSGYQRRARWMRLDTAEILKRFHFCERSLAISEAAWLPSIGSIDIKTTLPLFIWQSALTADALRDRVFELRYPSRLMTLEGVEPLVSIFDGARNAPSASAFIRGLVRVLLPGLLKAYREYLEISDPIADGPTHRILAQAVRDKEEQVRTVACWLNDMPPEGALSQADEEVWTNGLAERLNALGGVAVQGTIPSIRFEPWQTNTVLEIPDRPARDARFYLCRFYWPDIIDPDVPYGEGVALQIRSAVSHLNEAWAVETAGAILWAFSELLPWEWIMDAARWTYDESRHCRMGYERLRSWGLKLDEIPLGTYIYDSAAGQDPVFRLGMLYFFETKNIAKKPARTRLFHQYGDAVSEHDMDFDWADETIHAHYGKHWLREILKQRGEDSKEIDVIRRRCAELVATCVDNATHAEKAEIARVAANLITAAERSHADTWRGSDST